MAYITKKYKKQKKFQPEFLGSIEMIQAIQEKLREGKPPFLSIPAGESLPLMKGSKKGFLTSWGVVWRDLYSSDYYFFPLVQEKPGWFLDRVICLEEEELESFFSIENEEKMIKFSFSAFFAWGDTQRF